MFRMYREKTRFWKNSTMQKKHPDFFSERKNGTM